MIVIIILLLVNCKKQENVLLKRIDTERKVRTVISSGKRPNSSDLGSWVITSWVSTSVGDLLRSLNAVLLFLCLIHFSFIWVYVYWMKQRFLLADEVTNPLLWMYPENHDIITLDSHCFFCVWWWVCSYSDSETILIFYEQHETTILNDSH